MDQSQSEVVSASHVPRINLGAGLEMPRSHKDRSTAFGGGTGAATGVEFGGESLEKEWSRQTSVGTARRAHEVFEMQTPGCLRRALETAGVPVSRLELFEKQYYYSLAKYKRRDRLGALGASFRS